MTSTVAAAPRARKTFSRLKHVLDLPNLIDIQKASFDWFMNEGLRETIDDISPIEDYTGTLAVEFGEYEFGDPQFSIKECREKDLTYQAPLSMTVRFVNKDTGEIREQTRLHGRLPDDDGVRHVHHQRHRARHRHAARPLAGRLPHGAEGRDEAGLHRRTSCRRRGSWLELEIDKKGIVYARIDRKRKLPITTLLRALPAEDPDDRVRSSTRPRTRRSSSSSTTRRTSVNTLDKDPTTREEEALIEVFKKQRPGEPPTLDNARNLLRSLFFDPKRYDLTKVGRYKLNQRLGVDVPEDIRVLTTEDILALVRKLVELPVKLGVAVEDRRTSRPRRSRSRATRSATSSTSTSTSATAACAPSAS